jgi:rod shape-determining protein MreB
MRWDTGIDLGTANVRMADAGDGLKLDEPSLVGVREDGSAAYAGENAWRLLGRAPRGLTVESPLRDGVPESSLYTQRILQWLFKRGEMDRRRRHAVLISCAPFARPAYREALMQSALDAGATDVDLVRSDAMSALGSGVDLMGPQATLLIDVGAGKMTATLFTMGREAAFGYLPYGMNRINERIMAALRADYGFAVGFRTAEDIKLALASEHPLDMSEMKVRAAGLDVFAREPRLVEIAPEMILNICADPLKELMGMCQAVVANAPEELSADLNDAGATLAGGGAQLPGLDKLIGDTLGIPCTIAEAPALCGIRGLNAMLLESDRYGALVWQRMALAARR